MKPLDHHRFGFTLLEVLVAASIFSIIGMLATSIFVNISQNRQKIASRTQIYDDAQFILDQLSHEIASNTIDYEEYYNRLVIGGNPGMNFGRYATKFYYNTADGKANDDCADLSKSDPKSCVNTGRNPRNPDQNGPNTDSDANAFYSSSAKPDSNIFCPPDPNISANTTNKNNACVTQLFLINADGNHKTIIAPEKIDWGGQINNTSSVLSRASMTPVEVTIGGQPTKLSHIFTCATCLKTSQPLTLINSPAGVTNPMTVHYPDPDSLSQGADLVKTYAKDFIPFTPSRVDIMSIKFSISPVEDPYKAFAETHYDSNNHFIVHQPNVTISLQVQPISNRRFGTNYPPITVETKVTPGLFAEVQSYPPQMVQQP